MNIFTIFCLESSVSDILRWQIMHVYYKGFLFVSSMILMLGNLNYKLCFSKVSSTIQLKFTYFHFKLISFHWIHNITHVWFVKWLLLIFSCSWWFDLLSKDILKIVTCCNCGNKWHEMKWKYLQEYQQVKNKHLYWYSNDNKGTEYSITNLKGIILWMTVWINCFILHRVLSIYENKIIFYSLEFTAIGRIKVNYN